MEEDVFMGEEGRIENASVCMMMLVAQKKATAADIVKERIFSIFYGGIICQAV